MICRELPFGHETICEIKSSPLRAEFLMHIIAYNLLRALMARAGMSVEKASFKGTVDRLSTWTWAIWLAPTQRQATALSAQMLQSIAADEVPHRPHRQEPRAVKRRPKPYALLNAPRHSMKGCAFRTGQKTLARPLRLGILCAP